MGLVALVDGKGFDSPFNLECEIDLADIDVALQDELGVFLGRSVGENVPEAPRQAEGKQPGQHDERVAAPARRAVGRLLRWGRGFSDGAPGSFG